MFDLGITIVNSADPDWHQSKTLRVWVDPAMTPVQQRAALIAMLQADAATYQKQAGIYTGLLSLVGQSIVLPP